MRIRVLGCSGGIGADLRTTCLQVDDDVLIDAGTGLGDLTMSQMTGIRHIFVTHSHLDHIAGIPLMADSVFGDTHAPVQIHGLPETIDALRTHIMNWVIWPDFTELPSKEHPILEYKVMQPGDAVEIGGRRIEMISVHHVVPAVAYCVSSTTGTFAFSGDTSVNDTLWEALNRQQRLDALIVETAFANAERDLCEKARHYCPQLLAEDLTKLNHRPDLYITHLKPGAESQVFEECRQSITGFPLHRLSCGDLIQL